MTLLPEQVSRIDLSTKEDACMSLSLHPKEKFAIAGINKSAAEIAASKNKNCRLMSLKSDSIIVQVKEISTMNSLESNDFQKCCKYNATGSLFATGTTTGAVLLLFRLFI